MQIFKSIAALLEGCKPVKAVLSHGFLAAVLLVASATASAQTCGVPGKDGPATPSGIINSYHGGASSPGAGVTVITVASASGQRTNTRTLLAGDLILIMQMQDSVTPANAGLHEYVQITSVAGAVLTLNRPLTNSYLQTMNATGNGTVQNWQAVWVPQYSSAVISSAVTADRWSIATAAPLIGTGGIVAMDVTGNLSINSTITVTGAGFRGALAVNGTANNATGSTTTANNAYVTTGNPNGGQKGEGTGGTPPFVFNGTTAGINYSGVLSQGYALGAGGQASVGNAGGGANDGDPANAAGGINQYNGGGGGGGNAGAGGQGGNNWNSGTTGAALNQGSTTANIGNVGGGKGGNTQTTSSTRLPMGGGGGAGGANDGTGTPGITSWPPTAAAAAANGGTGIVTSSGASGGGVVLLRAGTLSATAGSIDASGYRAFNKTAALAGGGTDTDGGGGGGAGGSVFITAASGALAGTGLTINATGGNGGSTNYYNHGPGGGGGGGTVLTNFTGATTSVLAGTNGTDACCGGTAGNTSPKAWNSAPGTVGTAATTGGSANGVQGGAACLPAVNVTKVTTTPNITSVSGATASYSINLSNSGGAATNVFIFDATLPPGWAYTGATAPVFSYSPAPPVTTNPNASGAETTSAGTPGALPASSVTSANSVTAVSLRAAGSAPGVTPTTGNNTATFGSFFLPQNGSITVTFIATIPNTATVGVYHNPAGVIFLDPTRTTTVARMVSPLTNVNANRGAVNYSANTAYASGSTANVGGSNYSGLEAGPTTDNVTLLPDLSVTKSLNTPTFTVGAGTLNYVIIGRNNGRAIADQVFATTQATGQSATAIVSTSPSITDTLPTGMTVTSLTNSVPAIWTCTPNGTSTTFTCSASSAVFPMAATTTLVTITATVSVSSAACPGPQTNTVVITTAQVGDAVPANNTATLVTPIGCSANLTVAKTDGKTTVTAGGTTSYTVTFVNLGPASGDGTTALDTPGAGLSCTVANCTASGTGVCPAAGVWPNLLSGGLPLASFQSGATVNFVISCNVTATGQ